MFSIIYNAVDNIVDTTQKIFNIRENVIKTEKVELSSATEIKY